MSEPKNPVGLATARDFENLPENQERFGPPERITLPSGLTVLLRRPRRAYWGVKRCRFPASLSFPQRTVSDWGAVELTEKDKADIASFWTEVWIDVFVSPRVSLNPAKSEIHPGQIPDRDVAFLYGWAGAQIPEERVHLAVIRDDESESKSERASSRLVN